MDLLSQEDLRERYLQCETLFKTEDILASEQNVVLGDHIAHHRSMLTIHFLCTGLVDDRITLRYVGLHCKKCYKTTGLRIKCRRPHEIKTKNYTFQEMQQRNMFKVIWPENLKNVSRDVSASISLAEQSTKDYHGSDEFVTWCIYGVSLKLQVRQPFFYMHDVLNTIQKLKPKKSLMAREQIFKAMEELKSPEEASHSSLPSEYFSLVSNNTNFEFSSLEREAIGKLSPFEQRQRLLPFKDLFKLKEISNIGDVSISSHVVFKRERVFELLCYYHSALVIDVDIESEEIELIEYSTPNKMTWNMLLSDIPMIVRTKTTLTKLINESAQKVQWPKALESKYTSNEVVTRARQREGETAYRLLKNNCHHFVVWCKCGLNVSLDVGEQVIMLTTTFHTLVAAVKHTTVEGVIQVLVNISDEVASLAASSWCTSTNIGILLELLWALYQTYLTYCLSYKGVINDERISTEISEIWSKGSSRVIGGAAGAILGSAFGPIGSVAVGALGSATGHMLAALYQWLRQDSNTRACVMAAIKRSRQELDDYFKAPASQQTFQEFEEFFSLPNVDKEKRQEDYLQPIYLLLQAIGVVG